MPVTEWELVKDYSGLPEREDFGKAPKHPIGNDFRSAHVDIDFLVILLLEGSDLTSEMHTHLLKCSRCRYSMVNTVSDELRRWQHTKLCEMRNSIFREWRDAAEMYAASLSDLTGKAGLVSDSDLFKFAKLTETARKLTAQCRSELDEHIATHRC